MGDAASPGVGLALEPGLQAGLEPARRPRGRLDTVSKPPRYRIKRAGAHRFGPRRPIPRPKLGDELEAIALDRAGNLHALVTRGASWPHPGLGYLTNASGRWRESRVSEHVCLALYGCAKPSLLAYDSVLDRLVVLDQQEGIRIASKAARARSFGRFRPATAANRLDLVATSLTSRAGRTTVGLRQRGGGALYVMTSGHLARVPGTNVPPIGTLGLLEGGQFLVAAATRDWVQLAWQITPTTPIWDRSEQGVWTASWSRSRRTGRWSIRRVRHRTLSAYDRLTSLTTDALGRPLLAYTR